jgi:hypothetical protein
MTLADVHPMRILTALVFTLAAGCTGDLVELGPKTGGGGGADMATAGGGGGGSTGDMAVATGPVTYSTINADIIMKGCAIAPACHGVGSPNGLAIDPAATDLTANYNNVFGEIDVMTPAMSTLLTEPGKATHGGGLVLPTTDPVYQRWLGWITAGGKM